MTAATTVFTVSSLRCAGCIAKLEDELGKTAGVIDARVNFTSRPVRVAHADTLDGTALREAIERLGFPAEPFLGGEENLASSEQRMLARALGVAGFAAMNIMLVSVSIWSGAESSGCFTRDSIPVWRRASKNPAVRGSAAPRRCGRNNLAARARLRSTAAVRGPRGAGPGHRRRIGNRASLGRYPS